MSEQLIGPYTRREIIEAADVGDAGRMRVMLRSIVIGTPHQPELLPCPFCSGPAHLMEPLPGEVNFWVECDWCDAGTGKCSTDENAVANWNRRPAALRED